MSVLTPAERLERARRRRRFRLPAMRGPLFPVVAVFTVVAIYWAMMLTKPLALAMREALEAMG